MISVITDCQVGLDKLLEHLGVVNLVNPEAHEPVPVTRPEALNHYSRYLDLLRKAPDGRGNAQLNATAWVAARVFTAGLLVSKTEDDVKADLLNIVTKEWTSPHPYAGAIKTIDSGWSTGLEEPLVIVDLVQARTDASTRLHSWVDDNNLPVPELEVALSDAALIAEEEFGLLRRQMAKRLGISSAELVKFVKRRRSKGTDDSEEALQGTKVVFADDTPWPESVDVAALLDELAGTFRRFIWFHRETDLDTLALFTITTHCADLFDILPYLGVTAPDWECGKSTTLEVLLYLVWHALASSSVSGAVVYRAIEKWNPTFIVDEFDTFINNEKNQELVGIFNAGHKRALAYVLRTVGDDHEPRRFACFGPKIYGMIGAPPGTMVSRSIFVRLRRKGVAKVTEDLNTTENPKLLDDFAVLRRKIRRWLADHLEDVKNCKPDTAGLANRTRNNWWPLLKIATLAGDRWLTRAKAAAGAPQPRRKESDQVRLLRDIRNIFHTRGVDRIPSRVLLDDLVANRDVAWYRYRNKHDPLDAKDLADLLEAYEIGPMLISLSPAEQNLFRCNPKVRGYRLDQFEPLFKEMFLSGSSVEEVLVSDANVAF